MKTEEFVKTKHGLARRLEVSRNTLDKFLAMPGAPRATPGRGWPLAQVLDFIAANATNMRTLAAADPTVRELKAYELGLKCARLRFFLEKERGSFVHVNDICGDITRVMMRFKSILWQKLANEYPTAVAGLSPEAIRDKTTVLYDDLMRDIQSLGSEFGKNRREVMPLPEAPASVPNPPIE